MAEKAADGMVEASEPWDGWAEARRGSALTRQHVKLVKSWTLASGDLNLWGTPGLRGRKPSHEGMMVECSVGRVDEHGYTPSTRCTLKMGSLTLLTG